MRHEDTTPCRFHGCDRLPDTPVITNWDTYAEHDGVVLVTIQGWVEERCQPCARTIVMWPPKPA